MIKLVRIALAVLATALLGVALGAGSATAAPTVTPVPSAPSGVGVSALDAALAQPDVTKSVLLDAATGKVLAEKTDAPTIQPSAVVRNVCNGNDSCWTPARIPLAAYGFSGTGTVNGTWNERSTFYTRGHYASVCWNNGICSGGYGAGSAISFNAPVTGHKVTNIS